MQAAHEASPLATVAQITNESGGSPRRSDAEMLTTVARVISMLRNGPPVML